MPTQVNTTTSSVYSRRAFMKRAVMGAAALTAATMATGKRLVIGDRKSQLPGPGSIFEPRQQDQARHWRQKLGRFRLR